VPKRPSAENGLRSDCSFQNSGKKSTLNFAMPNSTRPKAAGKLFQEWGRGIKENGGSEFSYETS
jgi:hypothetical protein